MLSARLLFASIASLFISGVTGSASVTDCSNGASVFQLNHLDISPQTIYPGTDVVLTLLYTNPIYEINDGTVTTAITYNYIPFQPSSEPLCNSAKCPIVVGENNGSAVTSWPDVGGTIVSQDKWYDTNNNLLLCIQMTVVTGLSPSVLECPVVVLEKGLIERRFFSMRGSGGGFERKRRISF